MKADAGVAMVGISSITILELYALNIGINGIMLTAVIATIAAIIGVAIQTPKWMKK